MTTTTKTPKEWLQTSEKDLGVAFGGALTPGPWKHEWDTCGQNALNKCQKCGKPWASSSNAIKRNFSCPVPNPIDFRDWNIAKYHQKQCFEGDFERSMRRVYYALGWEMGKAVFSRWFKYHALPRHYLLAAVLSVKRVEDRDEDQKGDQ